MKASMSFSDGFLGPKWDDGVFHVYDDEKARRLVEDELRISPDLVEVYAGLDGDWSCNNDLLWKNGVFLDPKFHRQSIWARPSLLFVYADGREKDGGDCYRDEPYERQHIGEEVSQ